MHCCRGNRVSVPKIFFKNFYFNWEHVHKNKALNKCSNSIVVSTCSCCRGNEVKSHLKALSILLAKNKMLHCCFCALRYLSAKWPPAGVENVKMLEINVTAPNNCTGPVQLATIKILFL